MKLKKLREELKLTQKEMADIIKLERSSYGRMEQKSSPLRIDQLARLIKALELSYEFYQRLIFESIEDDE